MYERYFALLDEYTSTRHSNCALHNYEQNNSLFYVSVLKNRAKNYFSGKKNPEGVGS